MENPWEVSYDDLLWLREHLSPNRVLFLSLQQAFELVSSQGEKNILVGERFFKEEIF